MQIVKESYYTVFYTCCSEDMMQSNRLFARRESGMGNKVLVIGGAGYIGTVLVPILLGEGMEVTVLDNFLFDQKVFMECCHNQNFDVIRGDCRNEETVKKCIDGQDFIIPLAAIVGYQQCDADETAAVSTNVDSIKTLLGLRKPDQKVIFACTNSGYGIGESDSVCTEDSPLNPISLYGRTKLDAETLILQSGNSLSFRFATVFGASPRMRRDLLVNDFVYRAVFDSTVVVFQGNSRRNYVHVRDAAGAIVHGMKNFGKMKGLPFNCGLTSANMTKLELCAKIKEHIPGFIFLEAPIGEDPDKRDYLVSNERLENTGWCAKTGIDDGIEELKKAYEIIGQSSHS